MVVAGVLELVQLESLRKRSDLTLAVAAVVLASAQLVRPQRLLDPASTAGVVAVVSAPRVMLRTRLFHVVLPDVLFLMPVAVLLEKLHRLPDRLWFA